MNKDFQEKQVTDLEELEEKQQIEEEEDNPYLVTFKKPFIFEGVSHNNVDLSGLESLSAADMIAVNKTIERGGTVNILPEMSLEYACLISSRASGKPVEFFKALPPKDALKIKNRVTSFLYNED
ncbi:MAG: phage tail assembly protein [Lachnospiraceae bacterium]